MRFHLITPLATILATIALAGLPATVHTAPPQKLDQDRALAERGRGAIVPLERIVQAVAQQIPGRQVGVELEEDDGRMVYELKWLLADGRRLEIEIDARDGTWLQLKGSRLETVFRRGGPSALGATRP